MQNKLSVPTLLGTPSPPRARLVQIATTLAFLFLVLSTSAQAAVTEPPIPPATTGESVPQPTPAAETGVVMSRGFTAMDVTLDGLFKSRGETIDPVKDAQTTPGMFSPQCGFTGEFVLHGGGCPVGLGWYNATEGATTPPPQNQIYVLVPATFPKCPMPPMAIDPAVACCDDMDFCPLATYDTTQMPQHQWNMLPYSTENIRSDPRYKGGLIGFVLMGAGSSDKRCSQNKYSQLELNDKSPSGKPWVGTVIYQSTKEPSSYYLGFEDLPTSTTSWKGQNNGNDGDFNDFVFYISGITCKGGGKPCSTGMLGVCANGVTQCSNGEETMCKPIVASSMEVCDGLDNDCDGIVDNGNPCTDSNLICDKGKCVGRCGKGEFQCAPGLECDSSDDYCKDPSCKGVDCPAGQVCVSGKCQGGCEGVVCPGGRSCVAGACLDLCEGVTCSGSRVCENGVCVAACECGACVTGEVCAPNHHCVQSGCEKQTCNPPATICVAGACKDNCDGVVCPAGQACQAGVCVRTDPVGSGGFTGTIVTSGSGGRVIVNIGTGGNGVGAAGTGGGPAGTGSLSTCNCNTAFGQGAEVPLAGSIVLAIALAVRRARRRRD
jgi:hypothetical protein